MMLFGAIMILLISSAFSYWVVSRHKTTFETVSDAQKVNFSNLITASGDIEAENQTSLTFLNPGRVTYLGFKEGDKVQKGQVIASLDTTILEHNITASEAQYRSAQAALNKILDDIHLFQYGNGGFANVGTANETQTQKTLRQQAEEAVNITYDNLQNAKQQLALSTIVAPFDGTILSIQNISENANVSLSSNSSITLVGSGKLKFVSNILEQDINSIHEGQAVSIMLDSNKDLKLSGTVSKIASGKSTLANGTNVIKVDIQLNDSPAMIQPGQTGSISISSTLSGVTTVPSWVVLSNKYIWVLENGQTTLKTVKIGPTEQGQTVITEGLTPSDKLILNPQLIAKNKYRIL